MRRLRAAFLALLLVLLTGCAQIPTNGPIEVAPGLEPEPEAGVQIAPEPPGPGAGPRTVVEGFLQAIANYQPGYTVAREYLAEDVRESWQPESQVLIYADGYSVSTTPDSASLTAPLFGRIAADGSFSRIERELKLDFGLVRDTNGEWRIGNPPDGVIMTQYTFENFYDSANMYFYDPEYTTLVADPIFIPRGNRSATTLLQRLLQGPTEWVGPVVTSAIPPQTRLNVQSASVDSAGVVEVSLTEAVESLSEEQRTRLVTQFVWTLRQLDGLTGVRITVNGEPFAVREQGPDGVVSLDIATSLAPAPTTGTEEAFGIDDNGVVEVVAGPNGANLTPVSGPLGRTGSASHLAVSAEVSRAAVVTEGENTLVEAGLGTGDQRVISDDLYNLLRPDYSGQSPQELWFVGDDGQGQQIRVANDEGRVLEVDNSITDGSRISNFAISPDGLRFAAVREHPNGSTELGMGLIDRSGDQPTIGRWKPVSLDEPGQGTVPSAIDVGWLTPTSIMVLVSDGSDGVRTPIEVDQSGSAISDLGTPEDWEASSVAASSGLTTDRATVVGGGAWQFSDDFQWTLLSPDLQAVAYPG